MNGCVGRSCAQHAAPCPGRFSSRKCHLRTNSKGSTSCIRVNPLEDPAGQVQFPVYSLCNLESGGDEPLCSDLSCDDLDGDELSRALQHLDDLVDGSPSNLPCSILFRRGRDAPGTRAAVVWFQSFAVNAFSSSIMGSALIFNTAASAPSKPRSSKTLAVDCTHLSWDLC